MAFAEFVLKIRKYEERKESRLREPGENPGQLRCCDGKRNPKNHWNFLFWEGGEVGRP